MGTSTDELVLQELRALRAEVGELRAELRQALDRPAAWNEERRAAFVASLEAAAADGEENGFFTVEQVCEEMRAEIEAAVREREARDT